VSFIIVIFIAYQYFVRSNTQGVWGSVLQATFIFFLLAGNKKKGYNN